ncbi:MAG: hypothetical protein GFH27_549301n156 [Chloroflexi bacterium AL-W]|nr:hypothetical protein [Chloroflexi bacterium AL-N1]NOK68349.1 hypothetical protein [Chloroflexi bacterium AL-N10]NOK73995.1 hypothetical protein [Chloroflexi bacterium AL-N5]NOK82963.1 hypothetical protein [Chloroflexi bacterium AL-W]NOK90485.1 hypothetical protein [Chloroflexi bacterium AL-N15]
MTNNYVITTIRPAGPNSRMGVDPVLNNAGHVAGSYVPPGFDTVSAFLYDGMTIHHLGLQTGQAGAVTVLTNSGHVGGYLITYDPNPRGDPPLSRHLACVWRHDHWEVVRIPAYRHCQLVGITDDETMVIRCDLSRIAIYHAGAYHFLQDIEGAERQARAVNAHGMIVGTSRLPDRTNRGFVSDGTQIHTLGALALGSSPVSGALGINDHGVVVGISGSRRERHAFRYDTQGMHDLGTLVGYYSCALDINNHGAVVGYAGSGTGGEERALLWRRGELYDLNTLIDEPDWLLQKATAINDAGQIAGYGRCDDIPTVFLLTPREG